LTGGGGVVVSNLSCIYFLLHVINGYCWRIA